TMRLSSSSRPVLEDKSWRRWPSATASRQISSTERSRQSRNLANNLRGRVSAQRRLDPTDRLLLSYGAFDAPCVGVMAKQSRPPARPAKAPQQPVAKRSARPHDEQPESSVRSAGTSPATPAPPQRRSTYFEAVALYERGLEALQRHDYRQATEILQSVLRQY